MIAWTVRIIVVLLMPVVALAQLDRASQQRPELAVVVPAPFRAFSQMPIALIALATGSPGAARIEAAKLVRRRPMAAEHLFVLSMADLRAGREKGFARAFRAASTRGWRFAPLQIAAAQASLAERDAPGAAKRVAALWAAEGNHPMLPELTRNLLDLPGGAHAFGTLMARSRVWRLNFLSRAIEVTTPARAMETLAAARRAGARIDCDALAALRGQIEARGTPVDTAALACDL